MVGLIVEGATIAVNAASTKALIVLKLSNQSTLLQFH